MIIIGGTYNEICFEPRWEEKFGSGLRACRVINSLDPNLDIDFYCFGDNNTKLYLEQISTVFPKIKSIVKPIDQSISFYYDHPLIVPKIYPRLDTINKADNSIDIEGSDVLYFGLIEGNARVKAKRLVYDPQSPSNPIAFSQTGSTADRLAVVVNYTEATKLAGSNDVSQIKNYFFIKEKVEVLVLKMGSKGALVMETGKEDLLIPVYKTSQVWPIGSGDVFASSFAHLWFSGSTPQKAAEQSSFITAIYCSTRQFNFKENPVSIEKLSVKEYPSGRIYLAGPFFTYAQRWLIDQIKGCLNDMHLKVFSPWHDIGHGLAREVAHKDIEGLKSSKLVFAVIDGLDSGTLFEVGYAVSLNIPVIAYVENESEESVKMLEGTGCFLEKDLTTAIYRSLWILAENE